jgi:anti-sigma factor RsiW
VDPWTDRLSEYLDDELTAPERAELERHLAACEECRATLEALRAVVARAASLQARTPDADLWPGIEHRVSQLRPARRTFTFSLPQLAAAALVLIALSGGLVWMLRQPVPSAVPGRNDTSAARGRTPDTTLPVRFADETYDRAVTDLQRALDRDRARLDPKTVAVIEKNLAAIDAAIDQAQRALQADPSNTYLNGHLADARRRKLAWLRSVSGLAIDPEG